MTSMVNFDYTAKWIGRPLRPAGRHLRNGNRLDLEDLARDHPAGIGDTGHHRSIYIIVCLDLY